MKKCYRLNISCVNGDNYEFYVENKNSLYNLLKLHDHEGSSVIIQEVIDVTEETYYVQGK